MVDHDSFTLFHGSNNDVKVILLLMQCAAVIKFDKEVGCLVGEGPWVFVGLPNVVKVVFLLPFKLSCFPFQVHFTLFFCPHQCFLHCAIVNGFLVLGLEHSHSNRV